MRALRRIYLQVRPPHRASRAYSVASAGAADTFLGEDLDFEEHPVPGELPLPLDKPRHDWRMRATSKHNPGGIIDPPLNGSKVSYPRRHRTPFDTLSPDMRYSAEVEGYKYRFLDLLKAEEETEKSLIRTRLANWPAEKLKRDGYCLTGLSAFWLQSTQFGKPVAAFLLGPGIALPYHRFENGTQILLSRLDPLVKNFGEGSIVGSSETEIRIIFDEKVDLGEDTWRLDLFTTDVAYQRMRAAIQMLSFDPAEQERTSTAHSQASLQGTYLRDVLLASFRNPPAPPPETPLSQPGVFMQDQLIASWARRHAMPGDPVAVEGDPDMSGLNATQRRAVAMMLGERVSLVQGPPGTGKTKTIIEAVKLLKQHYQVPHPLLVCTYTNVAVDNLVEGFASSSLSPLRIASPARVKPSLVRYTLDAQLETHPLKPTLDKINKDVERLRGYMENVAAKIGRLQPTSTASLESKKMLERMGDDMVRKRRRAWAVQNEMVRDIVEKADVICTTCITSAASSLNVTDFPVVFLDEASMSTEPASLIALMKGSQHLALIGDHKQLPPVITSRKASAGGLGISLFERLTQEKTVPSIMLNTQYRMHPSLSSFPSSEFYNFGLQDGPGTSLLPPASSHLASDRPSVIFLDHGGSEEMRDRSRVNYNEARIVCAVVEDLLLRNPTMKGNDIGIIAPYAAQISLLTRLLRSNEKYAAQLKRLLGPLRAMQAGQIEVKTVDGFEGREKEVIIFSTVRNNAGGHIGFLADRRRMNVGLTRAKRGLFVVGSVGTLKTGRVAEGGKGEGRAVWRRYVEWLAANGAVRALRGAVLEEMLFPERERADKARGVYSSRV